MVAELGTALGLVLVIEGILYALFPRAMKDMMALAQAQPERSLSIAGIGAVLVGVLVVWALRG